MDWRLEDDMANYPEYIILHHSAGKDYTLSDFEAIRRFHIEVRGWNDIGYHRVGERVGTKIVFRQGRNYNVDGAHCPGMNARSIGICIVGNFETGPMDEAMKFAVITEVHDRMIQFDVPVEKVLMHRTAALPGHGTACPGRYFPYEEIIEALKNVDQPPAIKTCPTCGQEIKA